MAVEWVPPPGLGRPIAKESHLPVDRPGHPWPGRFALLTRQPMRCDSLIAVKCVAQREHEGGNGGLRSKASAAWLQAFFAIRCATSDHAGVRSDQKLSWLLTLRALNHRQPFQEVTQNLIAALAVIFMIGLAENRTDFRLRNGKVHAFEHIRDISGF